MLRNLPGLPLEQVMTPALPSSLPLDSLACCKDVSPKEPSEVESLPSFLL